MFNHFNMEIPNYHLPKYPPIHRFYFAILIFLAFDMFIVHNVKGQPPVSDSMVRVRLDVVQKMIQKDATNTGRWWWGWLVGYSAATVGQVAGGLVTDNLKTRQDLYLGAATTFVGAAGQFLQPVRLSTYPDQLSLMPENTSAERLIKLEKAEEFLQQRAMSEQDGRSWQVHAVSTAVNLASGLITWLGFKRTWQDGLVNFAINEAITEAQIWSQPMRAKSEKRSGNLPEEL